MTVAIVLAAGGSTRFADETPKLMTPFRGRSLLNFAVDSAIGAGLDHTIVVGGAVDLSDVVEVPAVLVQNDRWQAGMATSIWTGLDWAEGIGETTVVIGLGDQPFVPPSAWRAVADSHAPLAVALLRGQRRPPVRIARELWHLLPREGDVGAKAIMAIRPELVQEIACEGEPIDIDTKEDLLAWN
ncbi:MAG TPA: nucleotidyltransferase family protein [Acidimicrobiales bacterium]|nr:nucleotidyltransferase family protein [Acidimicrobiales bacterium]